MRQSWATNQPPIAALLFYFLLLATLALPAAHAADTPAQFDTPALEQRYRALLDELRCLVCQNQTLADSHADLAQDLRDEVVRQLAAGKSDAEIKHFLVGRYGDFVLY
ncbi:MAG: cytochrome c-type biogenesis protein, partial [Terriglobales bacterium]